MATLLVGFDSAWTAGKRGAIVAVVRREDGTYEDLGDPRMADFPEAADAIDAWQEEHAPSATIILLDQPAIVNNGTGQRPVEHIVCSSVSLRHGGMQPANTARADMFGEGAPVWAFLARFGGTADPLSARIGEVSVYETYPVLAMIAMGWVLEDPRITGRLPKYNPDRKKTFAIEDWRYVCERASSQFRRWNIAGVARWIDAARDLDQPRKGDQDKLDACLCLLVAVHLAEGRDGLMVGNWESGYIVVPHGLGLQREIEARCEDTARALPEWLHKFTLDLTEHQGTATQFERQVLAACLAGADSKLEILRRQADSVTVTAREHIGNGGRVEFVVEDTAPRLDAENDYVIDNVVLHVERVPNGVATRLYVFDGRLQFLRFDAYEDEWPKNPVIVRIDYRDVGRQPANNETPVQIRNAPFLATSCERATIVASIMERQCVGVDGARLGWLAVWEQNQGFGFHVYDDPSALCAAHRGAVIIAVDTPIGLSDRSPRAPNVEARRFVGGRRLEASRRHREIDDRGFDLLAFAILSRFRSWDAPLMDAEIRARVYEVEPEISFAALNGGVWLAESKKSAKGEAVRKALLGREFGAKRVQALLDSCPRPLAAADDVLDALVALWTARRIASEVALTLPSAG